LDTRAGYYERRLETQAGEVTLKVPKLTGPEIVNQAGRVDSFCDFVGSGGTSRGCAQALRGAHPMVRC